MNSVKIYNGFTLITTFLTVTVDRQSLRRIAKANNADYIVIRNSLGVAKSIIL